MLEHHRVPREDGRHDHVDGGEERVVPRRQVEDDAERLAHDAALAAFLVENDVRERGLGGAGQVAGALGHPGDLVAGLPQGLAHHAGDVGGDALAGGLQGVHRAQAERGAIGHRAPGPGAGGGAGGVEGAIDGGPVGERDAGGFGERVGVVDEEIGHGRFVYRSPRGGATGCGRRWEPR